MSGTTSLGTYLRDLRARRGLSLDELARLTRVASRYLEALEADAFSALPAPVFTRGYIRAYCQALHEPVEEALALYHGQSGRTSPAAAPVRPATAPPSAESEARSRSTVLVSFILLVVLGLALFGVTLALQSGRETTERRTVDTNASPSLSPPSISAVPVTSAASDPPSPPASEVVPAPAPFVAPRAVPPPPVATAHTAPPSPLPSASAPPAAPPASPDLSGVVASVTSPYRLVARVSEPTWL